jgi:hypothetical protein
MFKVKIFESQIILKFLAARTPKGLNIQDNQNRCKVSYRNCFVFLYLKTISLTNRIGGVMVSTLASSAV